LKTSFNIISYIFHPILILIYGLAIMMIANPYLLSVDDPKNRFVLIFMILMLTVGFPLLAMFLIKFLGINKDFKMTEKQERVVPLIITAMFYLWLFVNIKSNSFIPLLFSSFVLGATVAIFLSFFINNFSMISLHTVGMGSLVAMILLLKLNSEFQDFTITLGSLGVFSVHIDIILLLAIIFAGLVGTARAYLVHHEKQDLYGGYLIGFISQFIAYYFIQ